MYTPESSQPAAESGKSVTGKDTLYYDRDCEVCLQQAIRLEQAQAGTLQIVSTQDAGEDNLPGGAAMRRQLHLKTAAGTWLKGLDAAVQAWSHTRSGWLLLPLTWPLLRPVARQIFDIWELHRYRKLYSCEGCNEDLD